MAYLPTRHALPSVTSAIALLITLATMADAHGLATSLAKQHRSEGLRTGDARLGHHCHTVGVTSYCFDSDPAAARAASHPFDCPKTLVRSSFRSRVTFDCPSD